MKQSGFGIIGTGSITEWFLKGAREDSRFKAVGIYSRSEERGRRCADTHGIEHSYTSLNAMLVIPDVPAASVA